MPLYSSGSGRDCRIIFAICIWGLLCVRQASATDDQELLPDLRQPAPYETAPSWGQYLLNEGDTFASTMAVTLSWQLPASYFGYSKTHTARSVANGLASFASSDSWEEFLWKTMAANLHLPLYLFNPALMRSPAATAISALQQVIALAPAVLGAMPDAHAQIKHYSTQSRAVGFVKPALNQCFPITLQLTANTQDVWLELQQFRPCPAHQTPQEQLLNRIAQAMKEHNVSRIRLYPLSAQGTPELLVQPCFQGHEGPVYKLRGEHPSDHDMADGWWPRQVVERRLGGGPLSWLPGYEPQPVLSPLHDSVLEQIPVILAHADQLHDYSGHSSDSDLSPPHPPATKALVSAVWGLPDSFQLWHQPLKLDASAPQVKSSGLLTVIPQGSGHLVINSLASRGTALPHIFIDTRTEYDDSAVCTANFSPRGLEALTQTLFRTAVTHGAVQLSQALSVALLPGGGAATPQGKSEAEDQTQQSETGTETETETETTTETETETALTTTSTISTATTSTSVDETVVDTNSDTESDTDTSQSEDMISGLRKIQALIRQKDATEQNGQKGGNIEKQPDHPPHVAGRPTLGAYLQDRAEFLTSEIEKMNTSPKKRHSKTKS